MIAVIEEKERCVWGVGANNHEAMKDAEHWMQYKPELKVGPLSFVPIRDDAPIDVLDGIGLYEYCIFEAQEQPVQLGLI